MQCQIRLLLPRTSDMYVSDNFTASCVQLHVSTTGCSPDHTYIFSFYYLIVWQLAPSLGAELIMVTFLSVLLAARLVSVWGPFGQPQSLCVSYVQPCLLTCEVTMTCQVHMYFTEAQSSM